MNVLGWDVPQNTATILVALVPIFFMLMRQRKDTTKIKNETESPDGTTLQREVAKLRADVHRLLRSVHSLNVLNNRRHKENITRMDTLNSRVNHIEKELDK